MESVKTDTSMILKESFLHTICYMCSKPYNDPRILPCLHSFCLQCLHRATEKCGSQKVLGCPTCERRVSIPVGGVSAFPQNLHLGFEVEVAGYVSKMISNCAVCCDHCIDGSNGPAVVFCCTCRQFLCKHCDDHHRSGRQLSKHNIVGVDQDGARQLQGIMKPREHHCTQPNHENNKLNFYCKTCQCLIHVCGDCVPVTHKGHSITVTELCTTNDRSGIEEVLANAKVTVARVTEAIDANNKVREHMMFNKMDAHLAINQAFETLQQALQLRKTTLLSEFETILFSKTTALTLQTEMFEKVIEEIGYYAEVASQILQTHTDYEIAALKGLIETELSAVLKKVEHIFLVPNTLDGISAVVQTDGLIGELSKFGCVLDLSAPSPSLSTWTSTSIAKVKSDFHVKVQSKTSKGTVYPHGGLQMKAEMKFNDGAVVHGEVEDHRDGTYTTTLIPLTAGPHQLLITLDGQHMQNSPYDLEVLHKYDHNALRGVQQVIKCPSAPFCVAVHDNGDLYIGAYDDCIYVYDAAGHWKKTIGCHGNNDGQFDYPFSMAIKENTLHVADKGNNCITRLTLEGTFINKLSATGAAGVLVDENKKIFVSDCLGHKIYAFDSDGGNRHVLTIDGNVTGDSRLRSPYGLAFDPLGNIHVAASDSNTIKVFTKEGVYIRKYGNLKGPRGIAIDSEGYSFVTEYEGNCISIFDPQGNSIHTMRGPLCKPFGLALDPRTSSLYVANYDDHNVLKYSM